MPRKPGATGGTWQETAAARLAALAKVTSAGQADDAADEGAADDEEENDSATEFVNGPTISDIEAELEALQAKLADEQKAIEEVRSIRASRRQIDEAVVHATRRTGPEPPSFFLTGVACNDGATERKAHPGVRECYPNLQHEIRLAKEDALSDKIARLRGEPLPEGPGKGKKTAPSSLPEQQAPSGAPGRPDKKLHIRDRKSATGPQRTLPILRGPGAKGSSR